MNFLLLNHIIALFLAAGSAFAVGIFVLFKSRKSIINKTYAAWSLSVAFWSFFMAMAVNANDYSEGLFFSRLMFAFASFISVTTAHFVISFLNIKVKKWFIYIGYTYGIVFAVLSFTPYIFSKVERFHYMRYYPVRAGIAFDIWVIIFFVYVIYQLYHLFIAYKLSTGVRHNQIAYVFWASLFGYTGGLATIIPGYNIYIPIFHPFAIYLLVLYSSIVALAIFKYQLMDIRVIIKKAFFYSGGIALISGAIFGVSFLNSWFADNFSGFKPWMIPLLSGMVAFIIGNLFWKKTQEADKLKYEFLTVAAHKLRTPLTEIKWGMDALGEKEKDKEKKQLIKSVQKANVRLIELTEELLLVSRSESEQSKYDLEPTDSEMIVQDAVNDLKEQIKNKNIKLVFNFEKNLPQVNVDKKRIGSVMQILLENAISYTKDEIKITIDVFKDNVIFHIEDNGIGILKEDQSRIFSKFYRSHEAYLSETEGTGVGLFLAKRIINKHDGKIGVRSDGKEGGSTFWFSLREV